MDVRCDRCHSVYQLDDARLGEPGTAVQCRDCGHILVVVRRAAAAISAPPSAQVEDALGDGEWLLESRRGGQQRLHDLTVLHKWIIDRRVGREDRISHRGGPFQRLGDVAELLPFFDIMDSAERARHADTPSPLARSFSLAAPPTDGAATLSKPLSSDQERVSHRMPAHGALPEAHDIEETVLVSLEPKKSRGYMKLGLTGLVAGVVAYAGIALYHCGSHEAVKVAPVENPTTEKPAKVTVLPVPPTADEPRPAKQAASEPDNPGNRGPVVEPIGESHKAGGNASVKGDKALGLGAPAVGRKPVRKGLAAAPVNAATGTPQALAAQGYAAFDHGQYFEAIALFKRSLAGSPNNGTALFGLAESYRATGQKTLALKCYHRYVQLMPSGPDAGQARLQIRVLESPKR